METANNLSKNALRVLNVHLERLDVQMDLALKPLAELLSLAQKTLQSNVMTTLVELIKEIAHKCQLALMTNQFSVEMDNVLLKEEIARRLLDAQ